MADASADVPPQACMALSSGVINPPCKYHDRDSARITNVMQPRELITTVKSTGDRIRERREQLGLTQDEVATRAGVSQGTVANLESGYRRSPRALLEIARALAVPPEWLQDGGPLTVEEPRATYGASSAPGPDLRGRVPLISWVRAGDWSDAADPFQPGDAERWLECPVSHSPSTYALRVRGDSMTAPHGNARTYPEGCIIFVDPARLAPVNGQRIIAKLAGSDEVTFKVFKNEDGRIWLQPLNPQHPPIFDQFKVLGTVIGKWEDE